jgi:hypothetical protein
VHDARHGRLGVRYDQTPVPHHPQVEHAWHRGSVAHFPD